MPFAAKLTGKLRTSANSAVRTGVGKSLPVPPHRYEMLFWLLTVAHKAPFHPGSPLQMSSVVQGPTGTWLHARPSPGDARGTPPRVMSVFSLAAVTVQLSSVLEVRATLRTTECL